jgi:hypothetical protein
MSRVAAPGAAVDGVQDDDHGGTPIHVNWCTTSEDDEPSSVSDEPGDGSSVDRHVQIAPNRFWRVRLSG